MEAFLRDCHIGRCFSRRFLNAQAFYDWVEPFDRDEGKRIEVATRIARQIDGIGFALACDFLKEVGFTNFSKPDVHIKEISSQLELSQSKDDIDAFRAVGRVARTVGSPRMRWTSSSGQ